jgi:hypothetical protein
MSEKNGQSSNNLALAVALMSVIYTTIVAVVALGQTPELVKAVNRLASAVEKK